MTVPILAAFLHPSGLPHAETLGLPVWAQWLVVAAVVATAVWLVLDGRDQAADEARVGAGPDGSPGGRRLEPDEQTTGEALVVGRSARTTDAAAHDEPPVLRAPAPPRAGAVRSSGLGASADIADWPQSFDRFEVAPGARRVLPPAGGKALYVETGSPDLECEQGSLLLHRANLPRVATSPVATTVEAGRMVRLTAGDLALPAARSRLVARNSTDRPAAVLLLAIGESGPATWLNPVRFLTLVLGVVSGVFALDRARAVVELTIPIPTDGAVNASRCGFAFASLLLVGAALAPVAPRFSALVFLVAGGVAAFLATASSWQERLEWWGASTVLTAWERLPLWSGGAVGLALLALAGWRYRPPRRRRYWGRA